MLKGTTPGFSHEIEYQVCKQIVSSCPSIEMVRLCNSGTDAVITAYRIAKAYTGFSKIIKMQGDYNGGFDLMLYDIVGMNPDCFSAPASEGLIEGTAEQVITVPFNNIEALQEVFQKEKGEIAEIIMEPILPPCILPKPNYLKQVRSICDQYQALLIFDEIKTGFCSHFGSYHDLNEVRSDLTLFGKAVANGLPISMVGGKKELMETLQMGQVHHCGTYFGNFPCTASANKTLSILSQSDYSKLQTLSNKLAKGICDILIEADFPGQWTGSGAMFGITIGEKKPKNYTEWWKETQHNLWDEISKEMLDLGIICDGFIGLLLLSFAHTPQHVDQTLDCCKKAVSRCKEKGVFS